MSTKTKQPEQTQQTTDVKLSALSALFKGIKTDLVKFGQSGSKYEKVSLRVAIDATHPMYLDIETKEPRNGGDPFDLLVFCDPLNKSDKIMLPISGETTGKYEVWQCKCIADITNKDGVVIVKKGEPKLRCYSV